MYKYIHTCIYIHISCPHTYTHTHIYTHAYKMYIWTHAKHVWNDGAAATARAAPLDTKKLCPSPCPHHDSARSRPHLLGSCGADPPSSLSTPAPSLSIAPRNEVIFLPFWRGFSSQAFRLHAFDYLRHKNLEVSWGDSSTSRPLGIRHLIFLAYLTSARSNAESIIQVSVLFGVLGLCCSYMCIKNTSFVRE